MQVTYGVINGKNARPPKPHASPHDFTWPSEPIEKDRRTFAASLQELLPPKDWTHAQLARELWGTDKYTSRNISKARDWVRGLRFPNETEAAYVAEVLDVPMARLMQPEGAFNPTPDFVRKNRTGKAYRAKAVKIVRGKYKPKAKANGHDHDADVDFIWPEGVDPPVIKMETSKKNPMFMLFELRGEMPYDVATAIMSMIKQSMAKRRE